MGKPTVKNFFPKRSRAKALRYIGWSAEEAAREFISHGASEDSLWVTGEFLQAYNGYEWVLVREGDWVVFTLHSEAVNVYTDPVFRHVFVEENNV